MNIIVISLYTFLFRVLYLFMRVYSYRKVDTSLPSISLPPTIEFDRLERVNTAWEKTCRCVPDPRDPRRIYDWRINTIKVS